MEPRNRRWRVALHRWDAYVIYVEAQSRASAEERALEMYEGMDDPEHQDGGIDSVSAEEEDG
jgi:hypothetical protein